MNLAATIFAVISLPLLAAGEHRHKRQAAPHGGPRLIVSLPNPGGADSWHLALTGGRIVLEGSCVRVSTDSPNDRTSSMALVFPDSYRYTIDRGVDGVWVILNSRGEKWAKVGESRVITGGQINDNPDPNTVPEDERRRCHPPYWQVTPDEAS